MPISYPQVHPIISFPQSVSKHSITVWNWDCTPHFFRDLSPGVLHPCSSLGWFSVGLLHSTPSRCRTYQLWSHAWVDPLSSSWALVFLFHDWHPCSSAAQPQIASKRGCIKSRLGIGSVNMGAGCQDGPHDSAFAVLFCVGRAPLLHPTTIIFERYVYFDNNFLSFIRSLSVFPVCVCGVLFLLLASNALFLSEGTN